MVCKWWCGANRFPTCAKCQKEQDRADAEIRRREAQRSQELAEIERVIEGE
jgi:hypothetical protein